MTGSAGSSFADVRPTSPLNPPEALDRAELALRGALLASVLVLVACLTVLGVTLSLRRIPEAQMLNIFYWFQREQEAVPLMVHTSFVVVLIVALLRGRALPEHERASGLLAAAPDVTSRQMWLLAASVTLVTWAITHWVMHDYALSGDEWSASFQARIFARGVQAAPVPEKWQPYVNAMLPPYIRYDASHHTWESMYLPVHAAIRSLFVRVHAESLANPVLAGLTVVGVTGVSRRLWPGEGRMQWLALGMLVSSAQFLLMSGTAYAMPAHLCLNTWWLWCWLRRDESAWHVAALPVIGVAALGLHQVFPHALFSAPFLIRLLRERRWARTIGVGLTYAVGCIVWLSWMKRAGVGEGAAWSAFFGAPDLQLVLEHLVRAVAWQAPLVAVLVICSGILRPGTPAVMTDLFWGILLTTLLYAAFHFDQQHGWGYRYAHGVLVNGTLLSALATPCLLAHLPRRDTRHIATAWLSTSALLLGYRSYQAERVVAGFANAASAIRATPSQVALVPTSMLWYGGDFVRNAPFFDLTPIIMSQYVVETRTDTAALAGTSRVQIVVPNSLYRAGLPLRKTCLARPIFASVPGSTSADALTRQDRSSTRTAAPCQH